MNSPVISFFNNKGGVGKTTLVYHLSWMAAELGLRVLAVDLDPQANLTAVCLSESKIEELWNQGHDTVYGAISPLLDGVGDVTSVETHEVTPGLSLLAGDLKFASAEQEFAQQWPASMDGNERAYRVLSSVARVIKQTAAEQGADVVLVDVGPSLGAINRVAMVATDHVVVPLSPDLFSIQGLRNLGPTLSQWRREWADRLERGPADKLELPSGQMLPLGYVVLQHSTRLDRPVAAYERWIEAMPQEYRAAVLDSDGELNDLGEGDENCLGMVKNYHSLIPLSHEARRPIFMLRSGDGAIGAHHRAVAAAYDFFEQLTSRVLTHAGIQIESRR